MDTALIVVLSGVTLMLLLLAVVILSGWGDGLIAGYNTAKEDVRNQFNIKRLRILVAALLLVTVAFIWLVPVMGDPAVTTLVGVPILFGIVIIGIILANTWCKKK